MTLTQIRARHEKCGMTLKVIIHLRINQDMILTLINLHLGKKIEMIVIQKVRINQNQRNHAGVKTLILTNLLPGEVETMMTLINLLREGEKIKMGISHHRGGKRKRSQVEEFSSHGNLLAVLVTKKMKKVKNQ